MVHPASPGGGTSDTSLGPGRFRVRRDMSVLKVGRHALEHDHAVRSQVHLRTTPNKWGAVGHKHEAGEMTRHLQSEPEARL